ncbi:hypothetical protein M9H77_03001 [Catharanthus roseus]|uniref:Uncharacterized protein n=1 Tax=Catharanthus roseus TaxID=4058 RepID=A0ACC0C9W2_CATRO|nr:hypothetical protein M9H77_03001 [Catharanthus roseus]
MRVLVWVWEYPEGMDPFTPILLWNASILFTPIFAESIYFDTRSCRLGARPAVRGRSLLPTPFDPLHLPATVGQPTSHSRRATIINRTAQVITFTTFNNFDYSWSGRNKAWIPLTKEDRLRERNPADFCSTKKTTLIGMKASSLQLDDEDDEADESYNPSDDGNDEADTATVQMDAF